MLIKIFGPLIDRIKEEYNNEFRSKLGFTTLLYEFRDYEKIGDVTEAHLNRTVKYYQNHDIYQIDVWIKTPLANIKRTSYYAVNITAATLSDNAKLPSLTYDAYIAAPIKKKLKGK